MTQDCKSKDSSIINEIGSGLFWGFWGAISISVFFIFLQMLFDGLSIYPKWVLSITALFFTLSVGSALWLKRCGGKHAFGILLTFIILIAVSTVVLVIISDNYTLGQHVYTENIVTPGDRLTDRVQGSLLELIACSPVLFAVGAFVLPLLQAFGLKNSEDGRL